MRYNYESREHRLPAEYPAPPQNIEEAQRNFALLEEKYQAIKKSRAKDAPRLMKKHTFIRFKSGKKKEADNRRVLKAEEGIGIRILNETLADELLHDLYIPLEQMLKESSSNPLDRERRIQKKLLRKTRGMIQDLNRAAAMGQKEHRKTFRKKRILR